MGSLDDVRAFWGSEKVEQQNNSEKSIA
jgi:hypothetical protein